MFITPEELQQLTGRKRSNAQVKVLKALGIEHRIRPDGSLVVLRAHVEQILGGGAISPKKDQEPEPDWGAMN